VTFFRVDLECAGGQADLVSASLLDFAPQGVIEQDAGDCRRMSVYFEDRESARGFAALFPDQVTALVEGHAADWNRTVLPDWKPLSVGDRLFLVPPWTSEPAPPGRLRIPMPPGNAYGTGMHAPTQIMLRALERHLQPGDRVLDLGTGAGLLSVAALALGAGRVAACDIDGEAVRAAREYAAGALVFEGSVDSVRSGSMDVVAANIDAAAIAGLAREIRRVLRAGGRALLGGFTPAEAEVLLPSLGGAGFTVTGQLGQEEWAGLVAVAKEGCGE